FFQAEDGIRDWSVTGVQTCALPIFGEQTGVRGKITDLFNDIAAANQRMAQQLEDVGQSVGREGRTRQRVRLDVSSGAWGEMENRSEERRVGKEGRYRCGPEGAKKRG